MRKSKEDGTNPDYISNSYANCIKNKCFEETGFLHEHPVGASSWNDSIVRGILRLDGVNTVVTDQCMFGLQTSNGRITSPAKKRTRFMSNASEVLKELNRKCDGKHGHMPLTDGRAKAAQVYPADMCRAICRGLIRQKEKANDKVKTLLTLKTTDTIGELPDHEEDRDDSGQSSAGTTGADDPLGLKQLGLRMG